MRLQGTRLCAYQGESVIMRLQGTGLWAYPGESKITSSRNTQTTNVTTLKNSPNGVRYNPS